MDIQRKNSGAVDPILAFLYGQSPNAAATATKGRTPTQLYVESTNERVELIKGSLFLGTAPNNDICLIEDNVAEKSQAAVNFQSDEYLIVNKSAANTTLLNGRPVLKPTAISRGDLIMVGGTRIRVE